MPWPKSDHEKRSPPSLLPQFKPTAAHGVQRPVVNYDSLGPIGSKTKVVIVHNGRDNITLYH